jgi:glyoxylase-like metal-dependent hydrolase (beta-lactamase superfamily II)
MTLERISDSIILVRGKNDGRFPYSHSFIIEDGEGGVVLLDTGCGAEALGEVMRRFRVKTVINSHTHPDHSAGNGLLAHTVRVLMPEEGIGTGGNVCALSERLAEPGRLAAYWREWVIKTMDFRDRRPDGSYREGDRFTVGSVRLVPIHTPGHTVDHYCLWEPNSRILFSFDYDLTPFGPWYGHRESDLGQVRRSLARLAALDIAVLLPSHRGPMTEGIKEGLGRYGGTLELRRKKIAALLKGGPKTVARLVDAAPIYGSFPYAEPLLRYWEGKMIEKHLDEMIADGTVITDGDGRYSLA